jgi:hypothetical protein
VETLSQDFLLQLKQKYILNPKCTPNASKADSNTELSHNLNWLTEYSCQFTFNHKIMCACSQNFEDESPHCNLSLINVKFVPFHTLIFFCHFKLIGSHPSNYEQ